MRRITRAGDRRAFRRLDVIGDLGVVLTRADVAILRDIGPRGALIDTTIGGLRRSHELMVCLGPSMPRMKGVIRHVSPLTSRRASRRIWHRVGLEFVTLSIEEAEHLRVFIARFSAPADPLAH